MEVLMMTVAKLSNLWSIHRMWEHSVVVFLKQLLLVKAEYWFFFTNDYIASVIMKEGV